MEKDLKLVLGYFKNFLKSKKLIILCVSIAFILGLFSVIFSNPIYKANTSFISQDGTNSGGGSGLRNIAALIGVNVGGSAGFKDIPVYLYPKLTGSVVYKRKLLNSEVILPKDGTKTTIREYIITHNKPSTGDLIKSYTVGLPGRILKSFKSKPKREQDGKGKIENVEYLSEREKQLFNYLDNHMQFKIDNVDGSLQIEVTSNNPVIVAQITEKAKEILQELIIEYRIGKLKDSYSFIETQYDLKKKEYEEARASLAYYTDRNRFNSTATSLIRKKELENRSNLAYSLFSELQSQKIQAQISLKEETPIFSTINPSVVPLNNSNPNPLLTMLKFVLMGLFIAAVIFILKVYRKIFLRMWKEI